MRWNKPYILEITDSSGDLLEIHYFNHPRERWIFTRMKGYR